jgi:outer membrane lipoprotein-sorting protein
MKKILLSLAGIIILACGFVSAQSLDEVLAKYNKANGQDKLEKIKTYTVLAVVNQGDMELPMTMKMKRPDKFFMELDVQGQLMHQGFDGKVGWQVAPWVGPEARELTGAELDQAKDQANIDGPFYKYKERGMKLDLAGKVDLNGKPAYQINVTDKTGGLQSYFLDANTYYLLSVKRKVVSEGNEMEIESKMGDYIVKDGIAIATSIESSTPMGSVKIKINKVEFDTPVDDAIFSKPAK